jgi:hypothetical protein
MIKYGFCFRNPEVVGWSPFDELAMGKISGHKFFQHLFKARNSLIYVFLHTRLWIKLTNSMELNTTPEATR